MGINVHGLLNVLEEASAAVYGDNPAVPKVETMLPEPRSPYAITKLDGEYYLGMFQREGRLETTARTSRSMATAARSPSTGSPKQSSPTRAPPRKSSTPRNGLAT